MELFLLKLGALVAKITVAFLMMYAGQVFFNWKNDETMEDVLKRLKKDPMAEASYYGRRNIAFGLVILGCLIGSLLY